MLAIAHHKENIFVDFLEILIFGTCNVYAVQVNDIHEHMKCRMFLKDGEKTFIAASCVFFVLKL